MKLKYYISGPISNNPNYVHDFAEACELLTIAGHDYIDPSMPNAEYNAMPKHIAWKMYMHRDIAWLYACDAICMLDGWEQSRGARIERWLAMRKGMSVLYINTL